MNLEEWLKTATKQLSKSGISTARLDCLVLLEDITGKDRAWLIAHPDFILDDKSKHVSDAQLLRRAKHEPLSYIRGKTEFYGREFIVNAHTLEPRPETETMIDLHKSLRCEVGPCNVVDVGTGSGCLAITAKLELPASIVYGIDIDPTCTSAAKKNADKLDAKVKFLMGNLLEPLPSSFFEISTILLCNLPYVPASHTISAAAMFEPRHAIFGGEDGLDLYRQLFAQVSNFSQKPIYIFTESLPFQHKEMTKIAGIAGYNMKTTSDFIQLWELPIINR